MIDSPPRTPEGRYRSTLWRRGHRLTSVGAALAVTLVAFEFVGVATSLPTLVADLHGGRLYAWPVAAFTAASAVGTVAGGRYCDRHGPGLPIVAALGLFAVGLLVGGTAHSMPALLAGRVVQGFGGGAEAVSITVLIAAVYPERDRPAASAMLSAAWVLPALLGPAVAGFVTERFGWRWVFLGLVPLVVLGLALLVPVVRRVSAPTGTASRRHGLLAGFGAAAGVSLVTAATQHLTVLTAPLAVAGVVLAGFSLRKLLPPGVVRGAPGLPSVILSRGLLAGAYAAVETYVPLLLTAVHGFTPAEAGLPLTVGAVGWAVGSAWQGRHPDTSRTTLLVAGFALVAVGLAGTAGVALPWWPAWAALPAWAVAGAGMGIGVSSISVLVLAQSPPPERGFHTSAAQLAEMSGTVVLVGVGGALVNAFGSTAHPSGALFVFAAAMCGLAVFGALVPARRSGGRLG